MPQLNFHIPSPTFSVQKPKRNGKIIHSPLTSHDALHDALSNTERWEKLRFYQLHGLFTVSVMVTIKMGGRGEL
jgi:hypothetical protein